MTLVTLGIYGLVWQYKTFQEMQDYSGNGIGGVVGLILAIFVGFVNWFLMPAEVGHLYGAEGQEPPVTGVTGLWNLLPIVGTFIWLAKTQNAFERVLGGPRGRQAVIRSAEHENVEGRPAGRPSRVSRS